MKQFRHVKLVIQYYLVAFCDAVMPGSMPVPDFNYKYDETMLYPVTLFLCQPP